MEIILKAIGCCLLILAALGCTHARTRGLNDRLDALMTVEERILLKRTPYLSAKKHLPENTPYDDKPKMREVYLREYERMFLLASDPKTAGKIPFEVYGIFETEEDRVRDKAWHAGRDAGWDRLHEWSREAVDERERDAIAVFSEEDS